MQEAQRRHHAAGHQPRLALAQQPSLEAQQRVQISTDGSADAEIGLVLIGGGAVEADDERVVELRQEVLVEAKVPVTLLRTPQEVVLPEHLQLLG